MGQAAAARKASGWHLDGLLAVALGHGVNDLFSGTVAITLFVVVSSAHLSPWYQGALGFLWYLTSSIVQPLFGAFTDRHGRWWFMPSGVLLCMLATSAIALATSVWVVALLVILAGCGAAIMHPEAGKYAALLSGDRRSTGISIFQIGGSLGFALGPVTIAALLAHFGRHGALLLLIPGAIGVAYVFIAIKRADALAATHREERRAAKGADAPTDVVCITLVVLTTALRFLATTAFVTYLPNLLTARGATLVQAGEVVTAFLLVAIVGMYLGGELGDRLGPIAASVVCLVAAVPALLGFFVAPPAIGLALLMVGSVLLSVQNAPGVVIVQSMLPRNLGMALGLINGVAFGTGSLLVTVVGVAVTRVGAPTALAVVSLAPAVGAALLLAVGPRLGGRLAPRRSPGMQTR